MVARVIGRLLAHTEKEKLRESGIACSHNSTPSFLHLSFWYPFSLMLSLSLSLSLSPSSHPSPPSSLWQSIWPTQPCHPFNLSVLATAPISHRLVFVARQAGPGVTAPVPSLKACGSNSGDMWVKKSIPERERVRRSVLVEQSVHPLWQGFHAITVFK